MRVAATGSSCRNILGALPRHAAVQAAGRHAALLGRAALDLLVPPHCPCCHEQVLEQGLFCAECFARIGFVTEPCCIRCGVMFSYAAQGGPERLCPGCRAMEPVYARARAAFRYDAPFQRVILPFKHADRTEFCAILAAHMARAGAALLREADLLVPVPLHRRRLFQRRYNQAALLARALSRSSGVAWLPDALRRVQATPPLGHKGAAERQAMVEGAFAVSRPRVPRIAGRRVLLIDDVMTSGATANACASVLISAGAATVNVLVAARVPDPRLA
jgi:ComF family protein